MLSLLNEIVLQNRIAKSHASEIVFGLASKVQQQNQNDKKQQHKYHCE